jgi:excisionase family DNA binding protein
LGGDVLRELPQSSVIGSGAAIHGAAAEEPTVPAAVDPSFLPPVAVAILAQLGVQLAAPGSTGVAGQRLMDADGVAAVLQVSRWSIYRWASAGRIPSVRLGRRVRFELDQVIAALRHTPTARPAAPPHRAAERRLLPGRRDPHAGSGPGGNAHAPSGLGPQGDLERLRATVAATRALGE